MKPRPTLIPILVLTAALLPVGAALGQKPAQPAGTAKMVERLRQIAEDPDKMKSPFANGAHALYLEKIVNEKGPAAEPPLLWAYATELLNAGRTDDAIARFDQLEGMMRASKIPTDSNEWKQLRLNQAIANLRRAEEDNCIEHHNPSSCMFPIQGTGVHSEKRGSRAAAEILTSLLEENPAELHARWLLNIAVMTLGEYPQGVPQRWLLAPELFASEYDIGRFPDIAGKLGLDVDDLAGGSVVDDFDGDGYLDIVASSMGLTSQLRYFHNDANGRFTERTAEAGLTGLTGGLNAVQTDYDNDGRPDVLVLRGGWMREGGHHANSLLHNDGNGVFSDVTEEVGVLSFHPTQAAVWFDFDGDGRLDLYIGNESTPEDPSPSELYRNNPDGTFSDCAKEYGLEILDYVKGVTSGDFNNDGRPDIYVSVKGAKNRLYRNDGPAGAAGAATARGCPPWRFTDVAAAAGVVEPIHSFATWFFDYDNDGWEDIYVSGFLIDKGDVAASYLGMKHTGELPRLYRNNHDGTFSNVTHAAGMDRPLLVMGANYGDLDNDGWLDMYLGTGSPDLGQLLPNRAFRNNAGKNFQDVTTSGGFGHLQKGHGISFADFDNDGDQDIYHIVGGAYETDHFRNALFENPGHGNHWLGLKLEGTKSNRPGIGARIRVVLKIPEGGRTVHMTARTGGSFGASPLRQHIGLGNAVAIERVEIQWPAGGPPQILDRVEMDKLYVVREGDARIKPLRLKSFTLGGGPTP